MKNHVITALVAISMLVMMFPTDSEACIDRSEGSLGPMTLDALIHQNDPETERKNSEFRRELLKIRGEWLSAGNSIVNETDDEYAAKVMAYLRKNSVTAKLDNPSAENPSFQLLEDDKDMPQPLIMPVVTADDLKKSPFLALTLKNPAAIAAFILFDKPNRSYLFLRHTEPISPKWEGIILLQWGSLARNLAGEAEKQNGKDVVIADEVVKMHDFKNRLMSKFGGKPYDKLLMAYVKFVKIDKDNLAFPNAPGYDKELDEIFGPALSDTERSSRQVQLTVHAIFKYIEIRYAKQGTKVIKEQKSKCLNAYIQSLGGMI